MLTPISKLQDQALLNYDLAIETNDLQLPRTLIPGVYFGKYQANTTGKIETLRFVYQP
ncbi:MAG: hypothetical protein ABI378_00195 [Chitinophagaceae bacterium]